MKYNFTQVFKIRILIIFFLSFSFFISTGYKAKAAIINVSTVAALQTAINNAKSGDEVVLANNTYLNSTLNIGTSNITVRAATSGGVFLNGTNAITISGNYITFSGFQFTTGSITGNVISVTGSNNTITQLNFNGYSAQKYIVLNAPSQYNVVSYCNFENKPTGAPIGNLIHIDPSATVPGYHKIRYCSFQNMPGLGGDNGNECIRISNGATSTYISRTTVEFCYFNNTGMGDSEAISNKCRENVIRYNTCVNNQNAMFCFRNGDNCVAYGNFFIGAGGIRVKEANNIYCYNNYFENSGVGGTAGAVTYIYYTANTTYVLNNINFFHNTFVDCGSIDFDSGALTNTWANNIFKKSSGNIFMGSATGISWAGNIYNGTFGISIPSGVTKNDPKLSKNAIGYYVPTATSPAIDAASASYPAILDFANMDDDPTLTTDISGLLRPASAILKDVGCSEYTSGTTTNHPLALAEVGPSFLIVKANQTITFPTITSKVADVADFDPGALASSSLQVAYSSSNPDVATIVNGKIHLVGAGTSTITASQAGNGSFNPATNVTQTLTVTKQNQTITFAALANKITTDVDYNPEATASSGLAVTYTSSNTAVATIVNSQIHIIGVGTTNITASQAGNSAYNAASNVAQLLTVDPAAKRDQTITFNALTKKNTSDADFNPGATASSGLTVTYSSSNTSVATVVNGLIHLEGGGLTTITASQIGNASYNPASDVSQSLSVEAISNVSITLNPLADTYVYGTSTTTNYGTLTDLVTKKGSNSTGDRIIYMQFDISGQSIYSISSAKVRLYANSVPSASIVIVSQSLDNWTETGITYANCPVKGTDISSVSVSAAGAYSEWDVTSYIQSQFAINDNLISLVLNNSTADGIIVKFNSKESTSNTPQLNITLNKIVTSNSEIIDDNFKTFMNSGNSVATIEYQLQNESQVSAQIYKTDGQLVKTLINNELKGTGKYQKTVDISDFKSGIYVIRFISNNNSKAIKLQITNK